LWTYMYQVLENRRQ